MKSNKQPKYSKFNKDFTSKFLYEYIDRYGHGHKIWDDKANTYCPKHVNAQNTRNFNNTKSYKITRTHIEPHLSGEETYYYTTSRRSPYALLMIDIDAKNGEPDALQVAQFIIELCLHNNVYYETSTNGNGIHLYFLLDFNLDSKRDKSISRNKANKIIKQQIEQEIKSQVHKQGFQAKVDGIFGTYPERNKRGYISKSGSLAKIPRPQNWDDLYKLINLKPFIPYQSFQLKSEIDEYLDEYSNTKNDNTSFNSYKTQINCVQECHTTPPQGQDEIQNNTQLNVRISDDLRTKIERLNTTRSKPVAHGDLDNYNSSSNSITHISELQQLNKSDHSKPVAHDNSSYTSFNSYSTQINCVQEANSPAPHGGVIQEKSTQLNCVNYVNSRWIHGFINLNNLIQLSDLEQQVGATGLEWSNSKTDGSPDSYNSSKLSDLQQQLLDSKFKFDGFTYYNNSLIYYLSNLGRWATGLEGAGSQQKQSKEEKQKYPDDTEEDRQAASRPTTTGEGSGLDDYIQNTIKDVEAYAGAGAGAENTQRTTEEDDHTKPSARRGTTNKNAENEYKDPQAKLYNNIGPPLGVGGLSLDSFTRKRIAALSLNQQLKRPCSGDELLEYYEKSGLAANHTRDQDRVDDCHKVAEFTAINFKYELVGSEFNFESGKYKEVADKIAGRDPEGLKYAGHKKLTVDDIDTFIGLVTQMTAKAIENNNKDNLAKSYNNIGPPDSGGGCAPYSSFASRSRIIGLWRNLKNQEYISRSINPQKYTALYNLCINHDALRLYKPHIKPQDGQRGRGRLIGPGSMHPDFERFRAKLDSIQVVRSPVK